MSTKTVKVTVRAGHPPLQVRGKEVHPGESFEVTEDQAKWLESNGAIEPLKKSSSKTKTRTSADEDDSGDSTPTED